jgi:hypothetical protein
MEVVFLVPLEYWVLAVNRILKYLVRGSLRLRLVSPIAKRKG